MNALQAQVFTVCVIVLETDVGLAWLGFLVLAFYVHTLLISGASVNIGIVVSYCNVFVVSFQLCGTSS